MLEQRLNELTGLLASHDSVIAFKKAEEKINEIPELKELSGEMKAYQQEAVLFEKIGKPQAQQATGKQADQIASELSDLPIVQDYRDKMQDASDLLQYVTQSIQEKLNEELTK